MKLPIRYYPVLALMEPLFWFILMKKVENLRNGIQKIRLKRVFTGSRLTNGFLCCVAYAEHLYFDKNYGFEYFDEKNWYLSLTRIEKQIKEVI